MPVVFRSFEITCYQCVWCVCVCVCVVVSYQDFCELVEEGRAGMANEIYHLWLGTNG